jgi:zinc protease
MMHQLPVVEEHLQTEIERLIHSPVTTEELAKIRTQVANRFIFASESPREKAGLYGYYDRVVGNLEVALHYPEIVRSITPEEIQAVAATYLDPAAYSSITAVPRS